MVKVNVTELVIRLILTMGVFGLLLGSAYGLIGAMVLNALIAWRALREEQVLKSELPGYSEYMTRVRDGFVPYLLCFLMCLL